MKVSGLFLTIWSSMCTNNVGVTAKDSLGDIHGINLLWEELSLAPTLVHLYW